MRKQANEKGSNRNLGFFQEGFRVHHRVPGTGVFTVRRLGADKDSSKAWELMRRQQAQCGCHRPERYADHYHVGLRTMINKKPNA
jgi:hypothetical protein